RDKPERRRFCAVNQLLGEDERFGDASKDHQRNPAHHQCDAHGNRRGDQGIEPRQRQRIEPGVREYVFHTGYS
nr:hypothetical protein [Tanacetum cinerariifolium]